MGSNSTTALGWIWNQCAYNAAWQQVKKCPISSHYWPTSPVSTSFILTSWAHLFIQGLRYSAEPQAHRKLHHLTSDLAPDDWWIAAWQTYIWTKTGCPFHWVYSGSTMRAKGQPLACCVWRHLWLCRSKRLAARKHTSLLPARSALGILVP